ncbi:MAG: hypothetical protein ACK417_05920 [Bacteroidia bacterium]
MEENEHINNPLLTSLQNDLRYYADYLQGLAREILDSGTSKYPVFVAHQFAEGINIGKAVLQHQHIETRWSVNVSLMEEFVKKGIVQHENFPEFKKSWKDPEEFMCVFVLAGAASSFVYLPYKVPEAEE